MYIGGRGKPLLLIKPKGEIEMKKGQYWSGAIVVERGIYSIQFGKDIRLEDFRYTLLELPENDLEEFIREQIKELVKRGRI